MDNMESALPLATISGSGFSCGGPQTARGSNTLQQPICTAPVHTLYKDGSPAPLTVHRTILTCPSSSTRSCRRNLRVTFDEAVSFWFPGPGQTLLGYSEASVPDTSFESCIGSGFGSGPSCSRQDDVEGHTRQSAFPGLFRDGCCQGPMSPTAGAQTLTNTGHTCRPAHTTTPGLAGCCHSQPCNRPHVQTSSASPPPPTVWGTQVCMPMPFCG